MPFADISASRVSDLYVGELSLQTRFDGINQNPQAQADSGPKWHRREVANNTTVQRGVPFRADA